MKKAVFYLLLSLVFILAACGNNSDNNSSDSGNKGSNESKNDTVKIENNYEASGEKEDGSDSKKVKETVKVPKNPDKAVVFDYGAADVMKEMDLEDKITALPKGENNQSLPDFLDEFKDDKYKNTGSLKEVNYDVIAESDPDVIFISGRTANQKNLDEFKKAAPDAKVVYVGADDNNLANSMKKNTENIGKIYDKEDEAKSLNSDFDKKVDDMKDKTSNFDKKVMYLLVNEGELSTYGPGGRFGGLVYDTLGFKAADDNIKDSTHGQNVSNEYIEDKNPDVILAMDRGQAISGESTAKQTLNNDVLSDVNAIKNNKVYELDPKLWYFGSGSVTTTMKQIDELEKVVD